MNRNYVYWNFLIYVFQIFFSIFEIKKKKQSKIVNLKN